MGKVFIQLVGGLGNQMFIYAAGRALALRTNSELIVDYKTGFELDLYKRRFELSNFNIDLTSANRLQSFSYSGGKYVKDLSNRIKRHLPLLNVKIIQEDNNYGFNNKIITTPDSNVFLRGYWQSERYFSDFADTIKHDFIIKTKMPYSVREEASEITALGNRAVVLGVRRYQEVKRFIHGLTGKEYYLKAMELMSQKIRDPVFICFTEDHAWVKENLCGKFNVRLVSQKKTYGGAVQDLYLMKLFKNFIIPNSSYYWWAAWLANGRIVISSNNWLSEVTPAPGWILLNKKFK